MNTLSNRLPAARHESSVTSTCHRIARNTTFRALTVLRFGHRHDRSRPAIHAPTRTAGWIRTLISAALAACWTPMVTAALPAPSVRSVSGAPTARADRILVRPKADSDPALLQRTYAILGCTVRESFPSIGNLTVLTIPPGFDLRTTIGLLEKTGLFEYVEPDYVGHALAAPDDPRFSEQWSLNNTGGSGGISGADIKAVDAWSIAHDANVVVAVVDSGIRYTHQDLAANMWVNPGETGAGKETNGVDDDGDGYVDDVYGVNVLNHSGNPDDDWGHGSHVAGIIGAVGNNALGVTGVAWRTKLMACKFIDGSGNYAVSDAVSALDYARSKGANVVLAAWGGYSFTSTALRDAFVALRDAGIIVVAAAGNSGTNNDTTPLYPASYEYPNVISVAATDRTDSLASFSDYGALTVDLAAPGADILSCSNTSNSDYRMLSGTSMASAHVAGAVALVWSHFPTDTYQQVINRIVSTVDPVPALSGKVVSGGRLDLAAALTTPTVPVITSVAPPAATVGTAFTYQISASASPTSYAATNLGGTGLALNAGTGVISGTPIAAGTIISQLTATNAAGTSAPVTLTITVNAASTPDTTAPLIGSFLIDLTTATNSTASYVVTFDEPVTGVTADDFATNTQGTATATITGVTPINSSTYRVNFNFAGTSGSIQMAINATGTGITDSAGNAYVGGGYAASDVVALIAGPAADLVPPTIASFVAGTPTSSAVTYTLTFSEPVAGVTASDFLLQKPASLTASIGTITSDSTHTIYTVPVNYTGNGTLQLMVFGGATANIRDAATNWFVGGTGQLTQPVTVGTTGSVPVITSAATDTGDVGIAFIYQITASGSPTAYAATNLAGTGLSLNSSTGLISGTPTTAGTIISQLTATNAAGTSAPFTLTITVNSASGTDTTPPTITSFRFDTANETTGSFKVTFSEPVTGVRTDAFVFNTQGTASATITGITGFADTASTTYWVNFNWSGSSGSIQMAIKTIGTGIVDTAGNAFVGGGFTASDVVALIASPAADTTAPTVTNFTPGTPTSTAVAFTIAFSEPVTGVSADDFLLIKPTTLTAAVGAITVDGTGMSYTVPVTYSGSGTLQLMVLGGSNANIRDAATNLFAGGTDQLSPIVTLGSTGSVPAITSSSSAAAAVGTLFNYQITASGSPTMYTATNLTGTGLSLNPNTGVISGTPSTAGTIVSQVTATNAFGTSAAFTLTITVASQPVVPVVTSATSAAATVGQSFSYRITATGSPTSFAATNLAGTGLSLDASSGTISGTPSAVGSIVTQVTASNTAGTSAPVTVTITVTLQPVVPVVTSATSAAATAGQSFSYRITATGSPTSFAATNLAGTGLSLDANTGTISGTPSAAGTIVTQVTASNTAGTSAPVTVTITVTSQPVVPVVTSATSASATVGQSFSYRITATGSPTSFAATNLAGTGLSLDANTGTISGTPSVAGTIVTQVKASNAAGMSAPVTVTITVTSQPAVPVVTSATNASATVGQSFSYRITASGSPTSFAATNLAGTGLSLNASTGWISGTPNAVGTITTQVTATNATGTSAPVTVRITVNAAVTPAPVVSSAQVTGDVGDELSFTVSATNNPSEFALSSGPAWLSINASSGVLRGTPAAAGTFVATVSASNDGGTGNGTITFVISRVSQRVDFATPTSAIIVGQSVKLGATASSGLPITYRVISGHASVTGDTLMMLDTGPAVVRATQSGNGTWAAASADATITAQKAAQIISAQVTPQSVHADGTVELSATASSGLPVTYQLVSGPGLLSGTTLSFNGATGTVVIRATQEGDDRFNRAAAVDLTFVVTAIGQQVYLGKIGTDDFAVTVAADNSHGTFATRLSGSGEALVAQFTIAANGSFSAAATSMTPAGASAQDTTHTSAASQSRTISGTIANGVLSGTLSEPAVSFTAQIQGPSGATAPYAGLYTAALPGSASGAAYLFVGTNGQAYALIVTPTSVMSGSGTVSAAGAVNITTTSGQTIAASLDRTNSMMKGSINMADATVPIAGLSVSAIPTDRLINVSARLRVSGNDVTHASIAGFVISGTTSKQVLVRAVGPSLARFGVTNPLPNPQLRLFDRNGTLVAANGGWGDDAAVTAAGNQVGAFPLTLGSSDAALIATLPPGPYTTQISSDKSGVALIEVYDLSAVSGGTKPLINLSTRGYVGAGDDVIIAGFAVNGNQPKRVLIRALGPGLTPFGVPGVLGDPVLTVYDATGAVIATNDNWGTPRPMSGAQFSATASDLAAASAASGAFPFGAGSNDSGIIITLNPGTYSAVVSGAAGGSGAALVEVYEIPRP